MEDWEGFKMLVKEKAAQPASQLSKEPPVDEEDGLEVQDVRSEEVS